MLTIFACPKPFTDRHISMIQRNALVSWCELRPKPEVILMGNEIGVDEICRELGLRHVPDIAQTAFGTPRLDDIFRKAEALSTQPVLAYVNADIILMDDFPQAIDRIQKQHFLMVGYRTDADLTEPISLADPNWRHRLLEFARRNGRLHAHTGTDYFVFRRGGIYSDMPPFALGRTTHDNWLIWKTRALGLPVIDATSVVTCIHQNHGYSFSLVGQVQDGGIDDCSKGAEAAANRGFVSGWREIYTLHDADWLLGRAGLKPAWTLEHLARRMRLALPDRTVAALSNLKQMLSR